MSSMEHVDTVPLAASVVLLGALAVGAVFYPELTFSSNGLVSYAWTGLLVAFLVMFPYRPFRESWGWSVLAGAMVAAWGLHNVAGPDPSFVTGYGFVVLGVSSIVYALYDRFSPPE